MNCIVTPFPIRVLRITKRLVVKVSFFIVVFISIVIVIVIIQLLYPFHYVVKLYSIFII